MNFRRLVIAAIILTAVGWPLRAQSSPPPFALALTINDGTSDSVYRGWPLMLLGDAALMEHAALPFALDVASLTLAIATAQGPAIRWPLRRVTEFSSPPVLGPDNESIRVVWVLAAEHSAALEPGNYTARLSWAGRTSPPIGFTVADAPATLAPADEIRRALLQSRAALYINDTDAAMAALGPPSNGQPATMDILVQRARVHVERGEYRQALQATQRALTNFYRDNPKESHPPVGILAVEAQATAEMLKGAKPGPPPPALRGRAPQPARPRRRKTMRRPARGSPPKRPQSRPHTQSV